ncbi:MAG: protein-glutamate O-methyltransferase CheR, partial [Cyanobacteria bacterium HKST-UBA01]|nr:protein-glutamate O-methyltransferase CheR [Cyanobacteria bacterium HKST-UBA01]
MSKSISESLLNTMREWVELHLGHRISQSRLEDFEKRVLLAAAEAGFENPSDFIASLIRGGENNEAIGYMALYLTIGETYFFRDAMSYSVLKANILPEVLNRKKPGERLSIWSAGCSSGEEPYSIAMTAMTVLSDYRGENGPVEARILATDINKQSLKVARSGIYRRWSFRDIPAFIKEKYFTIREDETYALKDEVKSKVDFAMLNLAEDGYPSLLNGTDNLDIIFCRNVLIYFSPEQVTNTLLKFHKCLRPGGWLFLAPSEIPHPAPKFFHVQNLNGAIVMQKVEEADLKEKAPIKIVHSNYSYFGSSREEMRLSIDNLIEAPPSMPQSIETELEL